MFSGPLSHRRISRRAFVEGIPRPMTLTDIALQTGGDTAISCSWITKMTHHLYSLLSLSLAPAPALLIHHQDTPSAMLGARLGRHMGIGDKAGSPNRWRILKPLSCCHDVMQ
ncbi:uncharacterized protein IAS62_000476 [Cryptococcus decagattii]|uniref:Uncharacterized protein n=1 Tax=Cryptococcus decagattii TaxID=1859122 RepID=A0ABZ2AKZ0_9TREE